MRFGNFSYICRKIKTIITKLCKYEETFCLSSNVDAYGGKCL